ncbi:hypothetical protein CEP52_017889 [Fusarium oligoseptatum]|uniref:Uncharacterized protein n=1 Tax=Fusarium oligoseptatum TaxID=2604345 RepID=A0A428RBM3_9HYPO|nr:hypothetical protein CEP52_017889 [Fusarium oligoseptatum]
MYSVRMGKAQIRIRWANWILVENERPPDDLTWFYASFFRAVAVATIRMFIALLEPLHEDRLIPPHTPLCPA